MLFCGGQFFAHHPPENHINRLLLVRNVLTQGDIDERLIIPAVVTYTISYLLRTKV